MPAQQNTFVERRRDHVAADIRRIALELFDERGFDEVSVQDIAASAGMSSRTFFRYFASKDDVLLDYQRGLQARLLKALRDRPAGEPAVAALRNAFVETSTVNPEEHDAVVQRARVLAAAPTLRARAHGERAGEHAALGELLAARLALTDASDSLPIIVAAAMSAAAVAAWDDWVSKGGDGNPGEAIGAALDLLTRGLHELDMAPPRRKRQ